MKRTQSVKTAAPFKTIVLSVLLQLVACTDKNADEPVKPIKSESVAVAPAPHDNQMFRKGGVQLF